MHEDFINECKGKKEEATNIIKKHKDANNKLKKQVSINHKKAQDETNEESNNGINALKIAAN